MELDDAGCRRVVEARDRRFDGRFIHAVSTTGIYCRPSCPARTPAPANSRFFPTGAAAQLAGYRACKRCRPDSVPGDPEWNLRADAVGRAMRLIADGVVDREGVRGLARRVGYSERQLHRLLLAELGAPPLALARAQRAHVARTLIETTAMTFTEIAFAAGFGSIRQFNDTIREVYDSAPSELRRGRPRSAEAVGSVSLRLARRDPFDADGLWRFLGARLIDGIEHIDDGTYRRTLQLAGGRAVVELSARPDHVRCVLRLEQPGDLPSAVARCRRLLDLDADPVAVRGVVTIAPEGMRIPGTVDGFELAVRAVVGQQVSVSAARRALSVISGRHGERWGEDRMFPTPAALAAADPTSLPMPGRRGATLVELSRLVVDGELDLGPGADRDETVARLLDVAGIGPWTAGLISMRALGDPDVFLSGDVVLRRRLRELGLTESDVEAWRPWRSAAVIALYRCSTQDPTRTRPESSCSDE